MEVFVIIPESEGEVVGVVGTLAQALEWAWIETKRFVAQWKAEGDFEYADLTVEELEWSLVPTNPYPGDALPFLDLIGYVPGKSRTEPGFTRMQIVPVVVDACVPAPVAPEDVVAARRNLLSLEQLLRRAA